MIPNWKSISLIWIIEKVVERDLLRWHGGYEGQGLTGSVIDEILNHFKLNIKEIKEGVNKIRLS